MTHSWMIPREKYWETPDWEYMGTCPNKWDPLILGMLNRDRPQPPDWHQDRPQRRRVNYQEPPEYRTPNASRYNVPTYNRFSPLWKDNQYMTHILIIEKKPWNIGTLPGIFQGMAHKTDHQGDGKRGSPTGTLDGEE